jgi:ElaB/YqjD/DUF883 family membrane-anchored ribosome-binding protein
MSENTIEDEVEKFKQKNKEILGDIEKNVDESTKELKNLIKKNPLLAVGAAFAVGFLVGRVVTKKD